MQSGESNDRKKSPLKQRPLPQAGESLFQEMLELLLKRELFWRVAPMFLVILAGMEWLRWYTGWPPSPKFTSFLAILIVIIAVVVRRRTGPQLEAVRLGMRGEMVVGQMLERLRAVGYEVLHDITENGFNIDHVLIGPGGVFVVETKTISKPSKGDARVVYDGSRILMNGHTPDRDPIKQVQACADRVREILERAAGRAPAIKCAVLYPGWWVDSHPKNANTWVLNPVVFDTFLRHEPERLNPEDVRLFSTVLETYVRSKQMS